jgi:excisionase family DNA binding protein
MGCHGAPRRRVERSAHLLVMDANTTLSGLEPLLTIEALAEYLDVPVTTIRDWRTDGKGPCAIRVGGRVRFAVSDILQWLAEQRETEPGRGPNGR